MILLNNQMMEKQINGWKIFPAVDKLCKSNPKAREELSKYLHKQIWSPNDRQALLESLSSVFLTSKDEQFGQLFHPVLLDIATRSRIQLEKEDPWSLTKHQDFCIAISYCLLWSDIQRFAQDYIRDKPGFLPESRDVSEPKKKKAKKSSSRIEALCKAASMFARYLGDAADTLLPMKDLLPYTLHDNETARWYACQTVIQLQKMLPADRDVFLNKHFSDTDLLRLKNKFSMPSAYEVSHDSMCEPEVSSEGTHTKHMVLETDLCNRVTCVGGVMLSRISQADQTDQIEGSDLLPVPSNQTNLHSLALAVSAGRPVLLQGVVGSGKTTLVEHLAKQTGRSGPPQLLKIQLGDQMDSKALLGTYRCTEVPGEFIWQPGVLTQAVTQGYWVLLEDIDFAPMEVVSILLPLLETRTLAVPGHGDSIRAAPGFHLFATRRLVSSSSGWQQQQQNSSSLLLEKLWTTVLVEPLSRPELAQVLCAKYPPLETTVEKLLDIYFLLSAGHHLATINTDTMETEDTNAGKFLSHDGRLISTRDLITWCGRIMQDFDASSSRTPNLVLMEALDCFVSCLSKPARRQSLAEAIGAYVNITKVKAEYYCRSYKPDVTISPKAITVGRVSLAIKDSKTSILQKRQRAMFSYTRLSSVLLEKIAMCVSRREPVLLVGETGTGKTSTVQFLASQLGHSLHVINMNQQSDSADLLGGFKPVDLRHIIKPFFEDFEIQFCRNFSRKQNVKFIGHLQECFGKRKWDTLFSLMEHTVNSALQKFEKERKVVKRWRNISKRLGQLKLQVQQTQNTLAFTFMEGSLVKALRCGDWVLLDEINLAAMETLECLSGLLESDSGSVILMERGDVEPVVRHPDFRLFACMNPATDVGKKDLSPGIRNRFTELYVDELSDTQDLKVLVSDYLQGLSLSAAQVDGIVKFYLIIRNEAVKKLTDGTGHPPTFSLRTLCRALRFAAANTCGSVARSLYEGFCLSFLTQLDRSSHPIVEQLVCQHVVGKATSKSLLKQALPMPIGGKYLKFEGYWIPQGELEPVTPENYILTPSVRANLKDLARVVSAGQHPVLIQGETSVGKTSLIKWLAQSTGNVCVRVNNHEHTDLQEYVGCYAADENGKLMFKEGVLVEAMRKGHWIILDELNLAPTDVLEALNRLLDDNRELYITETQEVVKAHTKFMLFATQNPPGQYGGRKMLSRAFRNRFVELHYDEIPSKELETILHERCRIPLSYARRLISVMLELQMRRRGSGVFAGKMGYMTLRDLFRWADRYTCPEVDDRKFYDWDKHLAEQGYMLLAGRVRKAEEGDLIQEVIQKHFKCKISPAHLFSLTNDTSPTTKGILEQILTQSAAGFDHVVWTENMRRMAVLIGQAIKYKEPVLLVGETGCGKTTVCQLYSVLQDTALHSINCHLHTESADFLGGLRPVRSHSEDDKKDKLFEWVDGPLVQAMKGGAMFLIDEISLADDSVLERLNSVLEPERTVLLAEKGGGDGQENEVEQVVARHGFHVFATMNPGGDFGKKELSPALRNRFTEIWCPPSSSRRDLEEIIEHNVHAGIHLGQLEGANSGMGAAILDFVTWFSNNDIGKRCTISIRDILTWVRFINTCSKQKSEVAMETDISPYLLDPAVSYIHGACLVFLDGLGAGTTSQSQQGTIQQLRQTCLNFLLHQVYQLTEKQYKMADLGLLDNHAGDTDMTIVTTEESFCIPPFAVPKGNKINDAQHQYALKAPGTSVNAQRVLRALQLPRPLLLEGSPGVGKTSLVGAIARAAGRDLVRINLSEQTDVTDLFGADLPVEGAAGGVFAWRDGPLLQALKAGSWIVLDELNLASQSVLEGLNACLDHRGEVYVPELGKTFHIQQNETRLFACQNPLNQGGGRKGLPKSFLNRFTQVYIEPLTKADLMFIATAMYPGLSVDTLDMMVSFNMQMHRETVEEGSWGQRGSPWEFNLRDVFRWCDLTLSQNQGGLCNPGEYVGLIYADRMRTHADKDKVFELYRRYFPDHMEAVPATGMFHYDGHCLQIGRGFLKVRGEGHCHDSQGPSLEILQHSLAPLESVIKCVEMSWMAILVGPSGTGKSSVVEMLAQLTGNQLNVLSMNSAMDTTELLGGFEQADFSRHIEDVAADIHRVYQSLCRHLVLAESSGCLETVAKLQKLWQEYQEHHVTKTGSQLTSVEELEVLRHQVAALSALITCCKKVTKQHKITADFVDNITSSKRHLLTLKNKLLQAVPGKLGGAFEWRDSLLVQSLQAGHWLLVDNVNFCSASVLDRLNALLEPCGVLSINERGVVDGSIPTIIPHPNFRLFLTMDPRHGEISRAMRNRGVEIYIPGETEGNKFSVTDIQRLSTKLGLQTGAVFHWLLNLHSQLMEELPRGDKPSLQNLLHVCQQVVEHCNHGYNITKAVWTSCFTEYVQQQRHKESRQLSLMTLTQLYEKWVSDGGLMTTSPQLGVSPVRLPGVNQYLTDPKSASVSVNVALFVDYLHKSGHSEFQTEDFSVHLKQALNLAMGLSSQDCLPYTIDWLQNYSQTVPHASKHYVCKYVVDSLKEQYRHILEAMVMCSYKGTVTKTNIDHCIDIRWNQQLLQKCIQLDPRSNTSETRTHLELTFNRLHLIQRVQVDLQLARQYVDTLQQAVNKDKTRGRSSLHPAIQHLLTLYPVFCNVALDTIPHMEVTQYSMAAKVLSGLGWFPYLLQEATMTLTSGVEAGPRLQLFWKWFQTHTLDLLTQTDSGESTKFSTIIDVLDSLLGSDDSHWRRFITFLQSVGHPSPFCDETVASLNVQALELLRVLCCHGNKMDASQCNKVKVMTEHRQCLLDMYRVVADVASQEDTAAIESAEAALESFREILKKNRLVSQLEITSEPMEEGQMIQPVKTEDIPFKETLPSDFVQLWPLFEYLSTIEGWEIVNRSAADSDTLSTFIDFLCQYTTVDAKVIELFRSAENKKAPEQMLLGCILELLRKSPAVASPELWLNWSDTSQPMEDVQRSQKSFHQPTLACTMYELLSRADTSVTIATPANTKLNSSLKTYKEELTQLNHISRHIWAHAPFYNSEKRQTYYLDKTSFCQLWMKTLHCLSPLLESDAKEIFTKLLGETDLTSASTLSQLEQLVSSSQILNPTRFKACIEAVQNLAIDTTGNLATLGEAWVHLGHMNVELLTPAGPVDPVEKTAIKLKLLTEELQETKTELEVLSAHHRLVTGQELTTLPSGLVHPRVCHLVVRIHEITQQIQELQQQMAFRPTPSQYPRLLSDVQNYMSSVGSLTTVHQLIKRCHQCLGRHGTDGTVLQEIELWVMSQERFLDMLQKEYPLYRDVVQPFIAAVSQVVHGMHLVYCYVKQHLQLCKLVKDSRSFKERKNSFEKLVISVGRFPTISALNPSCVTLAATLTSDLATDLIKVAMQGHQTDGDNQMAIVSNSILLGSLLHIKNEAKVRGHLDEQLTMTLTHILETFVLSWQQQEQAKKDKEEQEASLYRFKDCIHGDERSTEEREEAEFRSSFPEFPKEYQDLVDATTLDDSADVDHTDDALTQDLIVDMTDIQMTQISWVHQQLWKHLVHTDYYSPTSVGPQLLSDWAQPLLYMYSAGSILCKQLAEVLSSSIVPHLLGGHLTVAAVQQLYINQASMQEQSDLLSPPEVYDIYHDANVPQVIQCMPVLQNVLSRVGELQREWPDHPTLKQLCEIVDRIKSFPITCPVMKILAGLELLLQKAQDWESNATQVVSLATQLSEVSNLIVQYRKLELSCWTKALDTEHLKYRRSSSRWWFHLYQLLQSALQSQPREETDGKVLIVLPTIEEVTKALKQFIEGATLGDYEERLSMVLSFHCQLVTMETTDDRHKKLVHILWNLYQFYSRFVPTVQGQLEKLRAPIEKELKGFVKIARWSDINYWALKQTTEKTHRTLHKHLKSFQVVLHQTVQGILGDIDDGSTTVSGADHSTWSETLNQYQTNLDTRLTAVKPLTVPDLPDTVDVVAAPLQLKLPQLYKRVNRHWKQTLSASKYSQHIIALDHFIGEVIEGIHDLQGLEIDRTETKEKQKSSAKHINLRKRKALSELFRYLTQIGISYRKGVTIAAGGSSESITIPPLDVAADPMSTGEMKQIWDKCLHYFFTCISRRAQFSEVILNPSKELGGSIIERCRGFSEHLYEMLVQQYTTVASIADQHRSIVGVVSNIRQLLAEERSGFSQDQARQWLVSCQHLIVQTLEGLHQVLVLLKCCPRQQGQVTLLHPSPLPVSHLHQMALSKHGDELHIETVSKVQELICQVKLSQGMLPKTDTSLFLWSHVLNMKTVLDKLSSWTFDLDHVTLLFSDEDKESTNMFTDTLQFLVVEIRNKSHDFSDWFSSISKPKSSRIDMDRVADFSDCLEQLVSEVLLVVQKLYKSHARDIENQRGTGPDVQSVDEEEEEDLPDGLLVKLLIDQLGKDHDIVNSDKILRMLSNLVNRIADEPSQTMVRMFLQQLERCLPLVTQYLDILHHYTVGCIATERTVGKLLSVLLRLFTDLAMKGFCIPPEFSDELSGEGATEFCDIEEGGLGEGEGVKNVSDQIENEDQLDEAKRPEDHKQDESKQPDVKSEENAIEMSEDFDGKVQDLEDADRQEEKEDEEGDDDKEEEVDKQMGDIEDEGEDKLDEQMWGSDEEPENESEDQKEESGPGDGKQTEPELVAKDDNEDKREGGGDKKDEEGEEEEEEKQKQNNLDKMDQENYDDDQIDPYHGKDDKENKAPEDMDLPDDLNLDGDDEKGQEEGEEEGQPEGTDPEEDSKKPPDVAEIPEDKDDQTDQQDDKAEDMESKEQQEEENAEEKNTEEKEAETEEKGKEEDSKERHEEEGKEEPGFSPEDEVKMEEDSKDKQDTEADESKEGVEHYGTRSHDTEEAEQCDLAQDQAGEATENNQQETTGTGQASVSQEEGHQGQRSSKAADAQREGKRKKHEREPGKSDADRTMGSTDQQYKRLKTSDKADASQQQDQKNQEQQQQQADMYEHVKDSTSHYDAQTLDVATAEQQQQQQLTASNEEEEEEGNEEDVDLAADDQVEQESHDVSEVKPAQLKNKTASNKDSQAGADADDEAMEQIEQKVEIPGDRIDTATVARGPESTIHTAMEHLNLTSEHLDLETLRLELESQLGQWTDHQQTSTQDAGLASDLWHRYEALTSSLAQDLCEQLRLVLEPTQATKLKGDYRTGKRLNMRKVIAYIASDFRKDKIWLRRTKPCKRQYQIMLAIDDSASMVDNHSKQMAFESLALISNALTLLEAGQLSICSFGETVNVLHPFTEQFSSQSGAHLLQYLTFEQKKTKIAHLVYQATLMMMEARQQQQHGSLGNPETSQLLLIMSDGRGLFMEGMEVVKNAVRQARQANIFLVFVIIDNPVNKDSILDIKVPVFKQAGQVPEIHSYMDSFPFPFYVILRDINALPMVLSDALRQWFELVTALDR